MSGRNLTIALYEVCKSNGCGNYGTNHNGSCGCLLLPRPCDLLERLRIELTFPVGYLIEATAGDQLLVAAGHPIQDGRDEPDATSVFG